MKSSQLFFTLLFLAICDLSFGQSYQATNKISAIVREAKSNKIKLYTTHGLSVKTDLERNEFTFQVPINSFIQTDTSRKLRLDSLLPNIDYAMLSFKGIMQFNKLDKDIANKQTISIQGTFYIGNQNYTTYLPVEFEFMDKQLLFDTYFTLDMGKFNISFPREYQDKISNLIEFRIDNGHLLTREQ